MRKLLNPVLRRLGYELVRRGAGEPRITMADGLARSAARSPGIRSVIDVGASTGRWSRLAQRAWPLARYFLIEANPIHRERLEAYRQANPRVDFTMAAAGDAPGELFFDPTDDAGGTASHLALDARYVRLPATTVDLEIERRGLESPYLIKLDTHGFEVPILEGAKRALAAAELLVIEAYNFKLPPKECLRFHELCAYLEARGFRAVDLCDPMYRPKDGALWQMDLFFAPAGRPEFHSNEYA